MNSVVLSMVIIYDRISIMINSDIKYSVVMSKKKNNMKKTYKAKGLCYGRYWGGGSGSYRAENYSSKSLEQLESDILQGIKDGSIDSGMGYEKVIGAVMDIETIETVTIDGKEFVHSEYETELYGDLSEDEQEFLLNNIDYM